MHTLGSMQSARSARGAAASRRPQRRSRIARHALQTGTSVADKDKPEWTGDSLLSRFVNWCIETPAIYGVMKVMAKNTMVSTAQKNGVPWEAHVAELAARRAELERLRAQVEDPAVTRNMPDYYLQPFHTYEVGNLGWEPAQEVDPASYAMALRTFKAEGLGAADAMTKLRRNIIATHTAYFAAHGVPAPATIVDVGASTGISTQWLADSFPAAAVTGLDLSPYFLAVALDKESRKPEAQRRIRYVHGLAEASPFADASVDFVVHNFLIHEAPAPAIASYITEAARILRPGGVLAFVDNNPRSATIQNLPPVLFSLMKSTEPHSDSYYSFDLEAAMAAAGFDCVQTVEADHRHRAVHGILRKP